LQAGVLPHKILLMMEPADCERAERELQALFPALNVVRSAPHLLEIMDASVNKASGIEVMLKHFGLEAREALSFGDNYNDLEMLRYTGTSVAMGNAPQPVKEAAGAVTSSNEEDGIYVYLSAHHLIA
jgi:Cof subfamily protein (haloacid dehalogenase superfamily)